MTRSDPVLAGIAREHLLIPTLKSRGSDTLDFHEVAVWQMEAALRAAFDAGARSPVTSAEPRDTARDQSAPSAVTNPLRVTPGTPLVPGKMYLRLYHGRTRPDQEMDDWGFVGPTFGPLSRYVHTYCWTFRIYGACESSEVWLETIDDMIHWDGCFYGDMEVFIAGDSDRA